MIVDTARDCRNICEFGENKNGVVCSYPRGKRLQEFNTLLWELVFDYEFCSRPSSEIRKQLRVVEYSFCCLSSADLDLLSSGGLECQ